MRLKQLIVPVCPFSAPQSPNRQDLIYIVEIMRGRDYLGEFEHIIVLALLRLEDRAYGVTVRQEIELRTRREVSIGAVYATLDRLETKGYVKSFRGDPTPERGGRSKRFFRVTASGVSAMSRTQQALRSMTEGLAILESYS
jgi:PadR family transcriptional regulator PadR